MDERDDLSADIAAAIEGTSSPAVTETPVVDAGTIEPPPLETPKEGDRARDESGRFKAKDGEVAPVKDDAKPADAAAAAVATQTAAAAPAQAQATKIAPPSNWKGAGKVVWDKLPQAVQKELSDDYASRSNTEGRLSRLDAAIGQERAQALAATYGSVEGGIQNLLAMSDMAAKNPTGFALWFCQQRGIDLTQLAGQGGGQGEQPTHDTNPLAQEVVQLRTMLNNFIQQQQQGQQTQTQSVVEQFASDPANPYFNDVRSQMGALISTGQAKDLRQAYDMAVWAHPEIRRTLIDAERQKQAQEAEAIATRARNASVSISGSPAGAKTPIEEPDDDLETTLRKAVSAHS